MEIKNTVRNIVFPYDGELHRAINEFCILFPDERMAKYGYSTLEGFDFSNQPFLHIMAPGENFTGCNFENTNLYWSFLGDSKMENCNFANAELRGVEFEEANLKNANLKNSNLGLNGLGVGANISGADLTGAILQGTNLHGTIYDDTTIFPEGFAVPYDIMCFRSEGS